jgi:hypothetical protein
MKGLEAGEEHRTTPNQLCVTMQCTTCQKGSLRIFLHLALARTSPRPGLIVMPGSKCERSELAYYLERISMISDVVSREY